MWIWNYGELESFFGIQNTNFIIPTAVSNRWGAILTQYNTLLRESGLLHPNILLAEIVEAESIDTSAIEGVVLDKRTLRRSIRINLGLESSGSSDYTQIIASKEYGIAQLIKFIMETKQDVKLTHETICAWHTLLGRDSLESGAIVGNYRAGRVVVTGGSAQVISYEAPYHETEQENGAYIYNQMTKFIEWYNRALADSTYSPLLMAAITHAWFVLIHPFDDGNGRLSRALAELALKQKTGLPIISLSLVIRESVEAYYSTLSKLSKLPENIDVSVIMDSINGWVRYFSTTCVEAVGKIMIIYNRIRRKEMLAHSLSDTAISDRGRRAVEYLLANTSCLDENKYISIFRISALVEDVSSEDMRLLVSKNIVLERVVNEFGENSHYYCLNI